MYFTEISKQENDRFTRRHPKGHIFQSSRWASVKGRWETAYLGGFDESGQMSLACVMLTRRIFTVTLVYIPRGPVCDYTDHALLRAFVRHLHAYCRENHISFMILDPDVPVKVNNIPEETGEEAASVLRECGLRQKKPNKFEQIQAGCVYRIRWEHQDTPSETCQKIFSGFDQKTRYNIRVAQRRGLSVEIYDRSKIDEDTIRAFCCLMRQTGRRDHFLPRDKDYFLHMMEHLYPNVKLFLVRYDPRQDLMRTREEMARLSDQIGQYRRSDDGTHSSAEKTAAKRAQIEKRLISLRERCKQIEPMLEKECVYLSGSIMAYWGDKSWYMYGASADYCRDTMPNHLLQWEMIRYSVELGLRMYDQRGVPVSPDPADPLYGLYRFKKSFGGNLEEFPGSFYLVRNPLVYWLYRVAFTRFKTLRNQSARLLSSIKRFFTYETTGTYTPIEEDT